MNSHSTFRRSKAFVGDSIGNDTIVINIETGTYYSLEPAAGEVWNLVGTAETALPEALVQPAIALVREGILEVAGEDTPSANESSEEVFFKKYTDMADILMADPIHDVDKDGWPALR